MPEMKNLRGGSEGSPEFRSVLTYESATTGKGGVIARIVYASIKRLSEIINVFPRPILVANPLTNVAAAMNPRALQMKIVETVPYPIP
jgi:hypothetical protein